MSARTENLKPCAVCRKRQGELKKSEFGSRFPHYVKCNACGHMTAFVTLPGVALKLWNTSKLKSTAGARPK